MTRIELDTRGIVSFNYIIESNPTKKAFWDGETKDKQQSILNHNSPVRKVWRAEQCLSENTQVHFHTPYKGKTCFSLDPYPAIFLASICKWIPNYQYWGTETNSRFLRLFSWHLCRVQLPSSMHPGSHPDQSVSPNIAASDIFFKSSYLGEGRGLRYFPNSLTVSTALRSKKSSPTL